MTHAEFVAAYRQGEIRVQVDRRAAERLVARRLLLPFVLLPLLGTGVALALVGHLFAGAACFIAGLALRFAVAASSKGFVLSRALQDAVFYEEVKDKGIVRVEPR
jgi:hypothetical protein